MDEKLAGECAPGAPGRLLGRGRDADVYDLGDGRVLRQYRSDYDHSTEIAALRHLHAAGFPVPRLFCGAADGRDMVFERIDGPTMLHEMIRRPWRTGRYARTLADLHRRLHAIAPPPGVRELGPHGGGSGEQAVLHLDLHPDNVLLSPHGPVVIDWSNASAGAPGIDLAQTIVIMTVAEAAGIPRALRPFARLMRRAFLRAFRAAAHADPAPHLAGVCRARLSDPNLLPVEQRRINEMLARA